MSITHTLTLSVTAGGVTIEKLLAKSAGAEQNVDESIPDSSTDLEVAFAADVSQLKSFYMVADAAITVETNDGSSPDDTFTLTADQPIMWHENGGVAIGDLFSADITSLFITNASGGAAQLQIRTVVDPTA